MPECGDDEDPDGASLLGGLVGNGGVGGEEQPGLPPAQLIDDVQPKPFHNLNNILKNISKAGVRSEIRTREKILLF